MKDIVICDHCRKSEKLEFESSFNRDAGISENSYENPKDWESIEYQCDEYNFCPECKKKFEKFINYKEI